MMNGALANRCFLEKPQGYPVQIPTSQGCMSLPGKIRAQDFRLRLSNAAHRLHGDPVDTGAIIP